MYTKWIRVTFILLSCLSALVFAEILQRIFLSEPENLAKLRSSSLFLYENKENAIFPHGGGREFANIIKINSWGFRDEEFVREKEAGVLRIAVLGDSQAEALQVEVGDTWQKVMARKLSEELSKKPPAQRVESYNFGVSGYGTDQEWLTLREKVWDFGPDMVILAFSPNDVGDTYKNRLVEVRNGKLEVITAKERVGGNWLGRAVRETYSYHLIVKAASANEATKRLIDKVRVKILGFAKEERFFQSDAQLVQGPFEAIASQKNPPAEVDQTWQVVRALISDMQRQSDEYGVPFLITVNIPRAQVRESDWLAIRDLYKLDPSSSSPYVINEVIAQIAKDLKISFYDPREDATLWRRQKGDLHFEQDAHFNENGHLFMGTKVAEFILDNKLIAK